MANIDRLKELADKAERALESCEIAEIDAMLENYIKARENLNKATK